MAADVTSDVTADVADATAVARGTSTAPAAAVDAGVAPLAEPPTADEGSGATSASCVPKPRAAAAAAAATADAANDPPADMVVVGTVLTPVVCVGPASSSSSPSNMLNGSSSSSASADAKSGAPAEPGTATDEAVAVGAEPSGNQNGSSSKPVPKLANRSPLPSPLCGGAVGAADGRPSVAADVNIEVDAAPADTAAADVAAATAAADDKAAPSPAAATALVAGAKGTTVDCNTGAWTVAGGGAWAPAAAAGIEAGTTPSTAAEPAPASLPRNSDTWRCCPFGRRFLRFFFFLRALTPSSSHHPPLDGGGRLRRGGAGAGAPPPACEPSSSRPGNGTSNPPASAPHPALPSQQPAASSRRCGRLVPASSRSASPRSLVTAPCTTASVTPTPTPMACGDGCCRHCPAAVSVGAR